jgi:uncharacterized protein YutE (UPF0331/DUF86 family)
VTGDPLIRKLLAFLVDSVAEIRQLAQVDRLSTDKVQLRFVEHTLQIAIQAMIDIAFTIAAQHNLGEPDDSRQAFDRLAGAGWIEAGMRDTCRRMVSFRNIVVHRYLQVDPSIVKQIVERDLDDLLAFAKVIRDRTP